MHADLFRDNVLFQRGHLSGVFDFYFAGCDAFLFDVAVCLNDWCVDRRTGRQDGTRAAAFLGAYESVRALTPSEHVLLPAMQRAGAFRFWLSRLGDLPRQAALLKPHDPSHFERMLRVLRGRGRVIMIVQIAVAKMGALWRRLRRPDSVLLSQIEAEGLYKREQVINQRPGRPDPCRFPGFGARTCKSLR